MSDKIHIVEGRRPAPPARLLTGPDLVEIDPATLDRMAIDPMAEVLLRLSQISIAPDLGPHGQELRGQDLCGHDVHGREMPTPSDQTKLGRVGSGFTQVPHLLGATRHAAARLLVIAEDSAKGCGIRTALGEHLDSAIDIHAGGIEADPQIHETRYDAFIIAIAAPGLDALRIATQLRMHPNARQAPVIMAFEPADLSHAHLALEIGMTDYVKTPIDYAEMTARLKVQLQRRFYADHLRDRVESTLALAMSDPLTDLGNRRFVNHRLPGLLSGCLDRGEGVAAMVLDLDRFKSVNDAWGHQAGDRVLTAFANLLRDNLRGIDLIARLGGEEFLAVMPGLSKASAGEVARRLCNQIRRTRFAVTDTKKIEITASIGLAMHRADEMAETLVERADQALYASKKKGRDRVTLAAA